MKKWFTIIIILFCFGYVFSIFTKDKVEREIISLIDDTDSYVISIHYPVTTISVLDQEVKNYVMGQYQSFLNKSKNRKYVSDKDEFNIDYDFFEVNNEYYNVVLKVYNYDGDNKKSTNYVQSYMYDIKKQDFINIDDIVDDKNDILDYLNLELVKVKLKPITSLIDVSISLDDRYIYIYYINNSILEFRIPLDKIKLKVKIEESVNEVLFTSGGRVNIIDPMKPVVAFTFDDGPGLYTEDILNTLKKFDANATFFVLGNKVEAYQEVLRTSIKNGNEIGNHTYNHKWLSRLSKSQIIEQISKTQNILKDTIGYTPSYLRPTYGSVNSRIRNNTDLEIVLWTIDTKDWKIKNVDRIVDKVMNTIEDGDIILMHDIFERTNKALEKLIPLLKEQGYQFVTISELKEVKLLRFEIR